MKRVLLYFFDSLAASSTYGGIAYAYRSVPPRPRPEAVAETATPRRSGSRVALAAAARLPG
jgi:hypothetical protein